MACNGIDLPWGGITYCFLQEGIVIFITLSFCLFLAISAYFVPILQYVLEPYFSTSQKLANFRMLILTLGGSLVGAAAITSSLVLSAMQINIERMP
jgi:hypothetical protein